MKNMKKLLGAMVALGLSTTAITTVVACGNPKSSQEKPNPSEKLADSFRNTYEQKELAKMGATGISKDKEGHYNFVFENLTQKTITDIIQAKDKAVIKTVVKWPLKGEDKPTNKQDVKNLDGKKDENKPPKKDENQLLAAGLTGKDATNLEVKDNAVTVNLQLVLLKNESNDAANPKWVQQEEAPMAITLTVKVADKDKDKDIKLKDSFANFFNTKLVDYAKTGLTEAQGKYNFIFGDKNDNGLRQELIKSVIVKNPKSTVDFKYIGKQFNNNLITAQPTEVGQLAVGVSGVDQDNLIADKNIVNVKLTLVLWKSELNSKSKEFVWVSTKETLAIDLKVEIQVKSSLETSFNKSYYVESTNKVELGNIGISKDEKGNYNFKLDNAKQEVIKSVIKIKPDGLKVDYISRQINGSLVDAPYAVTAPWSNTVLGVSGANQDNIKVNDDIATIHLKLELWKKGKNFRVPVWKKDTTTEPLNITLQVKVSTNLDNLPETKTLSFENDITAENFKTELVKFINTKSGFEDLKSEEIAINLRNGDPVNDATFVKGNKYAITITPAKSSFFVGIKDMLIDVI